MSAVEKLLEQARRLSPRERRRLVARLEGSLLAAEDRFHDHARSLILTIRIKPVGEAMETFRKTFKALEKIAI